MSKNIENRNIMNGICLQEVPSLSDVTLQKVVSEHNASKKYSLKEVKLENLWKEGITVVHLLRRFGCPLCRNLATEMSSLAPTLEKNGVKLVGVGLGVDALDSFLEGGYWKGLDLYIDEDKKLYKEFKLGEGSYTDLLKPQVIKRMFQARNVEQSRTGDKMQLGGTYILNKRGQVIYEFQQKTFGDKPNLEEMFKVLEIKKTS
eukprot:snap_masked-scaffold_8-processed-gene-4.35-mRNA-1 protein AED:1.00 eAED:1.00 QI:0/-1/0/0/-1/1/1/0/202